jgi:hypothetical protein
MSQIALQAGMLKAGANLEKFQQPAPPNLRPSDDLGHHASNASNCGLLATPFDCVHGPRPQANHSSA